MPRLRLIRLARRAPRRHRTCWHLWLYAGWVVHVDDVMHHGPERRLAEALVELVRHLGVRVRVRARARLS